MAVQTLPLTAFLVYPRKDNKQKCTTIICYMENIGRRGANKKELGIYKRRSMGEDKKEILKLLTEFLEKYPEQRFTQALAVLDINQHVNLNEACVPFLMISDNWEDKDSWVLGRMKNKLKEFGHEK